MLNFFRYYLGSALLTIVPLFTFPQINNLIFRFMGYKLHKSVRIFSSARIIGQIVVTVGEGTFIGHETLIMGGDSSICIGANCDISSRVSIISGTHIIDMVNLRSAGEAVGKDIIIEEGVWVGFGCQILAGVTIGTKSIIGGGSVVVNDIPPYCVAVGNPCKPIKKWNSKTEIFETIKQKF